MASYLVRGIAWPGAALMLALALLLPAGSAHANTSVVFNGGLVVGCDYDEAGATYTCHPFSSTQDVTIASGYTVKLTGAMTFDYNQKLTMSGSARLEVSGKLDIGDIPSFNLSITGGSLEASGPFRMGAQVQTIVADITAAHMDIGTGSTTKVTGNLSANGPINIASHATIVGNIDGGKVTTSSPVSLTGDVYASVSFNLASGSTLNGNLVSPKVELDPSPSRVNGNVTASNKLTIGSGSGINGNVDAGKVELQASDAYITGTALVDRIALQWHGRVYQAITCRDGSSGDPCGCVDDHSGYQNTIYAPVCTPPGGNAVHHYQIVHDGQGLTCQPEAVTVKACADAACSSLYGGAAQVTLSPNPVESPLPVFSLSNGSGAAYVRQTVAGTATLAIASATPSATAATTCVKPSGNSCAVDFADTGLKVTAEPRLAGVSERFTVEALKRNDLSPSSCIPLIANSTKTVVMRCAYEDPATNSNALSRNVNLANGLGGNASLACGSGGFAGSPGASLALAFDANGKATGTLAYDDVGALALSAEYTAGDANFVTASGNSAAFVVAPHHYLVDNASAAGVGNPGASGANGPVFTKASTLFSVRVTALSRNNIVTTNFGRESTPGRFRLEHQQVDPAPPAGGYKGSLSVPNTAAFSAAINAGANGVSPGRFLLGGLAWNEVGIMSLKAYTERTGLYAGFDSARLESGSVASPASGNIGRFIPDHFDTALATPDAAPVMVCPAGVFPITCAAGRFVYAAQPFGLTVSAMSGGSSPTLTRNYAGSYARSLAITAWNAAGASGDANDNPEYRPVDNAATSMAASASTGPIAPPQFVFTAGSGLGEIKYAFSEDFGTATQLGTLSRPVNVFFRATDTDGVTSLRTGAVEAGLAVVAGRLQVSPSYGSELLKRRVEVESQYWTGAQFLRNRADATQGGTALTASGVLAYETCTRNLNPGGACYAISADSTPSTLLFTEGRSWLRLNAPGAGRDGTVNLRVKAFPWLPSTAGRLTYGVYRSPVIYLRELH